jgi:uncharacterized protein (DUF342 family)
MLMIDQDGNTNRFGEIAVNMNFVPQAKLDRALVIQKLILSRTKVHMPIGKVLMEMGALTQEQIDTILETQRYLSVDEPKDCKERVPSKTPGSPGTLTGLKLIISEDKLSAYLCPSDVQPSGLCLQAVKDFIAGHAVDYGLVDDQVLSDYISQTPLPGEPFKIASGTAPVEGRAPEVIYHFDTDPLRIGTLKSDGTMDWKNRGEIPQVNVGDLLVEKIPGQPGQPGTSVCSQVLPPPRIRDPRLKCGKGAQKSEDGMQILAKADGTPKLSSDGKVYVFGMINIEGDIGVETGNIEFEGYVEAQGHVTAGYTVKAKGLYTTGIQDAVIEVTEDLICDGGIYGSTIKVGGNIKASHIHNCNIEILGDLVVKKEIFDSTIQSNGRCIINEGKIITSNIDAKKGIEAFEIGSAASNPCRLTVGFDRKYESDLAACQTEMVELKSQKVHVEASLPGHQSQLAAIEANMVAITNEQESYLQQQRQFEEQLRGEGPNPVEDDEEKFMLEEMIVELVEKIDEIDTKKTNLQSEADKVRVKIIGVEKSLKTLQTFIEKSLEKIELLEESVKVDPGLPVVKVSGTIYSKTQIIGPHKEMNIQEDMHKVRIAESKEDPNSNKYQIKISSLR